MKTESVEKLIDVLSSLLNENSRLHLDIKLLEDEYSDLNERFLKLEHEYSCLADFTAAVDPNAAEMFSLTEHIDESDSSASIPVNEMATTTPDIPVAPTGHDGIFPTPASAVHSMVTGTTDQKCHCLTTVLKELEPDPTTSRRILIAQKLFEYRKDENGKNRLMPTDWFKEYGISHGIIAEFTGHTSTKKGPKTFSWYKITEEGKDIIKGTAMGNIVWKYYAGPGFEDAECCGYFPVPASQD